MEFYQKWERGLTLPSGSWVGVYGDEELTSHIVMTGGSVPAS